MSLISTVCPECKATIKLDDTKAFGFCMNCGTKIMQNTMASNTNGISLEQTIQNYAKLAANAKAAGNNAQCEMYCNKILELDGTNAIAWALKGSAAGWQSSLSNLRIEEMILCYGRAWQFASTESQKETILKQAREDVHNTLLGIYDLQCDRFVKWPDADEAKAFVVLELSTLKAMLAFNQTFMIPYDQKPTCNALSTRINNCAVKAEKNIMNDYYESPDGHPSDFTFRNTLEKMGYCEQVYQSSIRIAPEDYQGNINVYENIINNHNFCINARSITWQDVGAQSTVYAWRTHLTLTDEAIASRKRSIAECYSKITECRSKIEERERRIKQERIDKYWNEHPEEKEKLETEREELKKKGDSLNKLKAEVQTNEEVNKLRNEIENLREKRDSLGFLKFKEKKALGIEINDKNAVLEALIKKKLEPIEAEYNDVERRMKDITTILTRDR